MLPTNGRLEGEHFQGTLKELLGKPFILERKVWYKRGREKSRGNSCVHRVQEVDCQDRGHRERRLSGSSDGELHRGMNGEARWEGRT